MLDGSRQDVLGWPVVHGDLRSALGPGCSSTWCFSSWEWSAVIHSTVASRGGGCELLGPVGIFVQFAITVVCAVAFLVVWWCESPRRHFTTWAFDSSKQVAGAAYGKLYNIVQSIVFARLLHGHADHGDECVWYLMSIATDCFFLTFLLWGANHYMRPVLIWRCGIDIGDYDGLHGRPGVAAAADDDVEMSALKSKLWAGLEPLMTGRVQMWLAQVAIWIGIITVVRLFVSLLLFFLQHQLYLFYANVFVWLSLEDETSKLVFSVLLFPAVADTFQIVMQDLFLKKRQ